MSFDLTNQYISQSFQQLTQISGSVLVNGTGSAINNLTVTASYATQALSASYAANVPVTASYAISASEAQNAQTATSASHAVQADSASTATSATTATSASRATSAASADTVTSASHAVNADTASVSLDSGNWDGQFTGSAGITGSLEFKDNGQILAAQPIIIGANISHPDLTASNPGIYKVTRINDSYEDHIHFDGNDIDISVSDANGRIRLQSGSTNFFGVGRSGGRGQVQVEAGSDLVIANGSVTGSIFSGSQFIGPLTGNASTATSASHAVNADTASFLPSSTRLNITDITASNASFTSASIGYLRTVSGSATIIGDEFIILNADTPAVRYAGIKIYDSGSNATASLEWDGLNDYFIQQELDGNTVGFVHGPSGSRGSETFPASNKIVKGTGTPVILDSSIVDDGTMISSSLAISSSTGFHVGTPSNSGSITGFVDELNLQGVGAGAGEISLFSASKANIHIGADNNTSPGGGFGIHGDFADLNTRIYGNVDFRDSQEFNGPSTTISDNTNFTINGGGSGTTSFGRTLNLTGSLNLINGNVDIRNDASNYVNISGSSVTTTQSGINNNTQRNFITMPSFTKTLAPNSGSTFTLNRFGYADYSAFGSAYGAYEQAYLIEQWNAGNYNNGGEMIMGAGRAHMFVKAPGSETAVKREALIGVLSDTDNFDSNNIVRCYGTTMEFGERNSYTINFGNNLHNVTVGHKTAEINLNSQHVNIGSAEGMSYTKIDGTTITFDTAQGLPTTDIDTWYTGSMILHQTGSLVAPALVISGSVQSTVDALSISSNTASLDCRASDFHTLTLVSGSDTFLNVNNVNAGQSFQVKVKQPGTSFGTLSYSSNVKFAGGTAPTITATSDAEDILTFTAFDGTNVYGTAVQNMS